MQQFGCRSMHPFFHGTRAERVSECCGGGCARWTRVGGGAFGAGVEVREDVLFLDLGNLLIGERERAVSGRCRDAGGRSGGVSIFRVWGGFGDGQLRGFSGQGLPLPSCDGGAYSLGALESGLRPVVFCFFFCLFGGGGPGAGLGREGGERDLEGVEEDAGTAHVEEVGGDAIGDLEGGGAEGLAVGDGGHFEGRSGVAIDAGAIDVVEAVVLAAHGGRAATMAGSDAMEALGDALAGDLRARLGCEAGQVAGFWLVDWSVDGVEHWVPPCIKIRKTLKRCELLVNA